MPITPLSCDHAGCDWVTPATTPDWNKGILLLQTHMLAAHGLQLPAPQVNPPDGAAGQGVRHKPAPVPRPEIGLHSTEAEWRFFVSEFDRYKRTTGVTGVQSIIDELWHCMNKDLKTLMQSETLDDNLNTEVGLKEKMYNLAVVTLHSAVHLVTLRKLQQTQSETIREFVARARNIASNCDLSKQCPADGCDTVVDYLDETVFGVVLAGLRDHNIQQRILSLAAMKKINNLQELVAYVAAEESGYNETANISRPVVHALKSGYQRQKKSQKCFNCGGPRHGSGTPEDRIKMCPANNKTCSKCKKMNHFATVCRSVPKAAAVHDNAFIEEPETESETTAAPIQFFGVTAAPITNVSDLSHMVNSINDSKSSTRTIRLPHSVHSVMDGWMQTRPSSSPSHPVTLTLDKQSYTELGLNLPRPELRNKPSRRIKTNAIFDTGAQLNVLPLHVIKQMQFREDDLFKVQTNVNSASNQKISICGGIILKVTASNPSNNTEISTKQLFYISNEVQECYLSKETCCSLQTIPPNFPSVGSCPPPLATVAAASMDTGDTTSTSTGATCTNDGLTTESDLHCSCPRRELPPATVPDLPFEATEENLPKIKQFILDTFKSSSFNVCQKQPLPLLKGSEPVKLFVDPKAKPVACKSPGKVPIHWRQQVKEGLEMDERLGVIEKVPENTPSKWISRMHITPKADGSPRRVVDFQPVNNHAPRQTHHTKSPWSCASSVPPNTRKSVLDAWHGYHSVPIAEEDRHYTTFLTENGTYRYKTLPQGFISAGDAYTQRTDKITTDFENKEKCVDDALLHDKTIAENYVTVCSYLIRCGQNGIIFSPKKFQFAEEEVNFLGFVITKSGIKPTPKFLQSIRDFPTPKNTTDVRSWFGAVGQINFAFVSAPDMQPFRHLLSTKAPFSWSPDLEKAFQLSKQEIIKQVESGVRSFDMNRPTALATDWSKWACGFWLVQKHCQCSQPIVKPGCCRDGWQTVFCGSKYNTAAESRYAPIEGEAMSASWAMQRCKYYLMGLPNFMLCLDHKPLISIFGMSDLGNIDNPRILRAKQKTMMYKFEPVYIPGKLHVVPDCFSRRSDNPIAASAPPPTQQQSDISNVLQGYQDNLAAPSWVAPPPGGARPGQVAALLGEDPATADHQDPILTISLMCGDGAASLAGLTTDTWHVSANMETTDDDVSVLTWEKLEAAAKTSPTYSSLHSLISTGAPEDKELWPPNLRIYYPHRHSLVPVGGVILLHDRPLIPVDLRQQVLNTLHAGHSGVTGMYARASSSVYWPNMRDDITRTRAECHSCQVNAPSNPSSPPEQYCQPSYPFESICSDFFTVNGLHYLAIVDRYSGWLSVFQLQKDDSKHLITVLRNYFTRWGIPVTLTTDGATVYTSSEMKTFLNKYGVHHRISAAYYPRGNKRSEVAVKSGKRLIMENLSARGSLDTDKLARALLLHRNQPDPVSGLSPSMVIFGRMLRDHLPLQPEKFPIRAEWRMEADQREQAFRKRHILKQEQLTSSSRPLPALAVGDTVAIQDKTNPAKAGKWTKTGIVTENLGFQNYEVKVHGSNNLSSRHRTHLRKIIPYTSSQLQADQYATTTLPPPIQYPSTPPPIQPPPITVPEPSSPPPSPPVPAPPRPHTRRPIKEKWIMKPSSEDIRKLKAQTPINVDTAQP